MSDSDIERIEAQAQTPARDPNRMLSEIVSEIGGTVLSADPVVSLSDLRDRLGRIATQQAVAGEDKGIEELGALAASLAEMVGSWIDVWLDASGALGSGTNGVRR